MEPFASARGAAEVVELAGQRILEQVRDEAMFLVDRQGRAASWNQGVLEILGWQRDDWIGQPLSVAFTPDDVAAGVPQAEMRQAAQIGRADDNRWMCRKNGERFYALGTLTRMLDDEGRLVGYLKALRDFTASWQLRSEREALRETADQARSWADNQTAMLDAAIESIADGVLVSDSQGIHRCNAAALHLLRVASLEELQLPPQGLVQRLQLRLQRAGPLLQPSELPFGPAPAAHNQVLELWATHTATGADLCMRCTASPIVVDGQVVGTVAVLSDLTDRLTLRQQGRDLNRVQTVLQERDAELRALVDGVRDYAIFTLNTEGCISSWHLGAELMKGYTAEEAIGMPFAQLFTEEDRANGRPQREMDTAARTGEYKGDGQRLRKDGTLFDAAVVLTALRSRDGQLLGFLKLTQDITQRRAQAARSDAERANHSKGEFLATISHELRTPLSAILGWAHVLERGVFDPETVKHGLAAISRNARLQVQLIEDLLDMNRIESGQLRLDLQRIELGGVIAAAIDSALPAASAKGIGLRTVFSPGSGVLMGDAARLQQVVGNLLNNAIKFTPSGGQISVSLSQWEGSVQIAVADTGQGIAADFLDRMFDRFQQQDASTTRRHGGLGIGLAIVWHLVQLHGGSVQAHSLGPGQGATFTVLLPVGGPGVAAGPRAVPAPPAVAAPEVHTPAPPAGMRLDGVSVLLVDDEADVRAVTSQLLQQAGAHVLAAASADEALRLLQADRPAVILSDIGMPVVDGYELLRRVRALPAEAGGQTPAAAFTAYTRPEDRVRALAAGYQLHLSKPVAPVALVQAVATLALR